MKYIIGKSFINRIYKMGFGAIMIDKIHDNNENVNIGYYEISSNHFNMNNFYMSINKSTEIIKFFVTKNFNEDPIRIVDYNKNEKLGFIPGVPVKVFGIVLMRAFKVLKMDTFPEHLHYMA
jgi:hypothetical protein